MSSWKVLAWPFSWKVYLVLAPAVSQTEAEHIFHLCHLPKLVTSNRSSQNCAKKRSLLSSPLHTVSVAGKLYSEHGKNCLN